MKIAIDISQIVYGTGVSVYVKNLVKKLLQIDKKNKYILFAGTLRKKDCILSFLKELKGNNFDFKIFPISPLFADFLWNKLHFLKIEKLIGKVDLVHTSDWSEPPSDAIKVTTIHDLSPLKFPLLMPKNIVKVHRRKLFWVIKESKAIIVPSHATKNDLLSLGVKKERIFVAGEGVDEEFSPASPQEVQMVKRKYKVIGKYLLAFASFRKNLEMVIKAFEMVKGGKDLKLVVIGQKLDLTKRGIRFTGYVTKKELIALYTGAEALVFPSFYEGFGLPILEAFSCGCPVVTSDISSMPEVAGNAAILVNPFDYNSIAEGILKALKRKKNLRKLGFERVKLFTWEKTAKEVLRVYNIFRK